ncbi:MAG: T9SS type A sorting domain-containing protein [Rhodothermales bacterium]
MKIGNWKLSIGKCKSALSPKGSAKLFYILHFTLFILQFPNLARAQTGNCEPALGEAILDAGNVRAKILNNGGLFWRGGASVYEVPKGSGVNPVFAAGIWIAGLIDGELRGAATRYGAWEFWAGPLDEEGNPPVFCKSYDKIWEIRKEDISSFLAAGHISNNLKNWPWYLGAPVVDGDGDPDNYNLAQGDLPELLGDQRLWWIMNDRGNTHEATDSKPIGLEVHASAHVFNIPGFISNVTFYDYQLINKNTNDLTDAYFAFFNDIDVGNSDDDYVGSDSLLHLGYAYNADNYDEGGYDEAPPAIGVTFLKTALAPIDGLDNDRDGAIDEQEEMIGVSGFAHFFSGGRVNGDPQALKDYYGYMQSQWKTGQPFTLGGVGIEFSTQSTKFIFPGDPVTGQGWSEFNPDPFAGSLPPTYPSDRRTATSTGPFTITSGDTLHIRFAIVWSRGNNNLDSVTALKRDVGTLKISPEAYYQPQAIEEVITSDHTLLLSFGPNFPNPFIESTTFRYSLQQSMKVRLTVYDMLGREVEVLVDQQQEAGIYTVNFEAGALPSGIYMARIELDHLRFTKRMVLAR